MVHQFMIVLSELDRSKQDRCFSAAVRLLKRFHISSHSGDGRTSKDDSASFWLDVADIWFLCMQGTHTPQDSVLPCPRFRPSSTVILTI